MIMELINTTIWIVLGLSTLFAVLDLVGLVPLKLRKKLRLNRADDTLSVLREMGVDISVYQRHNCAVNFPRDFSIETIEECVNKELEKAKLNKKISVGHYRPTKLDYYIDLIGQSCDQNNACAYAKLLSTYWKNNVYNSNRIHNPMFDFVVTPKGGSPILGYEFAKLIGKPLILHEETPRFQDNQDDFRAFFNCSEIPNTGKRALIVDDSTTGGTMVKGAISHLRSFGYIVDTCYVIFEPKNKDAREQLNDLGVQLISIAKTHTENKLLV